MFNKDREIWLYLIGILIMFGVILIFSQQVFNPFLKGKKSLLSTENSKPEIKIDINKIYIANLSTNYGVMSIELFSSSAPTNVNNFVTLSQKGFYNNLKFHRLIPDLLIQGGDQNTSGNDITIYGKGDAGYLINDEVNWDSLKLTNIKKNKLKSLGYNTNPNLSSHSLERYSLAMANDGPNTNSSQFFIVIADSSDSRVEDLNGYFTVIGKVINGTDALDKINKIHVNDENTNTPRPSKEIIIQKIDIVNL